MERKQELFCSPHCLSRFHTDPPKTFIQKENKNEREKKKLISFDVFLKNDNIGASDMAQAC